MVKTLNGAIAAVSQDTVGIRRAYDQLHTENIARDKVLATMRPHPATMRPHPVMQSDVMDNSDICRPAVHSRTIHYHLSRQVGTFSPTVVNSGMAITNRETPHRPGPHPHRSVRTSFDPHFIFMHQIVNNLLHVQKHARHLRIGIIRSHRRCLHTTLGMGHGDATGWPVSGLVTLCGRSARGGGCPADFRSRSLVGWSVDAAQWPVGGPDSFVQKNTGLVVGRTLVDPSVWKVPVLVSNFGQETGHGGAIFGDWHDCPGVGDSTRHEPTVTSVL